MENLINEAKNGNDEAFIEIILYIRKDLYKIAKMRFISEDDVNEVVQETIIAAYKNLHKLKKIEYFKTWIIRILINNCNKLYNRKKMQNKRFIEYSEENLCDYNNKDSSDIILDELDFKFLIKSLNYKERITLTLFYLEDLPTKDIGRILKEPESTIRNRISRAKVKLKNKLKGGKYHE